MIKQNKAQVTIFIILAILIVAILLVLFYPRIKQLVYPTVNSDYISQCAEDAAQEALDKLALQGGSLAPENYLLFEDNKIDYACYTSEYYKRCTMQKPFLKQDVETEIIKYAEPKVKQCFENLKSRLEQQGSSVSIQDVKLDVDIVPNSIVLTVNAPTVITKESAVSFDKFKATIKSQMYDLLMLASSISNYEARYGDSDSLTYMLYYPDIKVQKIEREDGNKVYVLTYKPSDEKFMFASRSIAWPAGYFGGING